MDNKSDIPRIENCAHYKKNSTSFTTFPFKVVDEKSVYYVQLIGRILKNGTVNIYEKRSANYKNPTQEFLHRTGKTLSAIFKLHSIPYKTKLVEKKMSFENAIKYMDKWQSKMEKRAEKAISAKTSDSETVDYIESLDPPELRKTIKTPFFDYTCKSVPFYPQVAREKGMHIRPSKFLA